MKTLLYYVVVLYNTRIDGIKSIDVFNRIARKKACKLIVFDNSTDKVIVDYNKDFSKKNESLIYICNEGNIGLSKCYNHAFFEIANEGSWIMLADDDTTFSEDYLHHIFDEIEKNKTNIITGIIKTSDNEFFSPKNKRTLMNKCFVKESGVYENLYAVNSGLTLSVDLVRQAGGYDEKLFLDMIDFDFMDTLARKSLNRITVVDGQIMQSFSGKEKGSLKSLMHRYRIFKKDCLYYSRKNNLGWLYTQWILFKRFIKIIYLTL